MGGGHYCQMGGGKDATRGHGEGHSESYYLEDNDFGELFWKR